MKGRLDDALSDLSKAIELNPRYAQAFILRGQVYALKGRHEDALGDLDEAIAVRPEDFSAYEVRARMHLRAGRPDLGLAVADNAIRLNRASAGAWDIRAHILEALSRREEAIADFRRALDINPDLKQSRDGLKRLGVAPLGVWRRSTPLLRAIDEIQTVSRKNPSRLQASRRPRPQRWRRDSATRQANPERLSWQERRPPGSCPLR